MGSRAVGAATIEEVAARAGVSRSTVSRVVNGSNAVSAAALEAVHRAIRELQYVPNRAARSLASRQTHAIALMIPEATDRFFGDPFFASIVSGIASRLARSDYVLVLSVAGADEAAKASGFVRGGGVDGALVVSHHTNDTFLDRIADAVPVVYGGRPARLRDGDYYVDIDNAAGARRATEYLIERGHRRIGTITGPATMPAAVDRRDGFLAAMAHAGLAHAVIDEGDYTDAGGYAAMRRILDAGLAPDALFVASDLMARGAYEALRAAGRSIPHDVAIVGFDDSSVASSVHPALTTVRQPSFEQGERMAGVLLDRLAGRPAPHVTILPTELVVRASA